MIEENPTIGIILVSLVVFYGLVVSYYDLKKQEKIQERINQRLKAQRELERRKKKENESTKAYSYAYAMTTTFNR